jgi:hypothetical protein
MIDIGSYLASLRASWVSRFVSGETHTLATKVNIGITNALIIIIFPRIVKFCFPQEKNKVFILSILFSQFNFSKVNVSNSYGMVNQTKLKETL